jgi:formylglycine-generating enzyme required for sulfatase activity
MADCDGCGSNWDKQQPAPVGSFPANKVGLYNMVGNVLVWIEDCVHQNYNGAPADGSAWLTHSGDCSRRILRGGSWDAVPDSLYFAVRGAYSSETRTTYIGIRVARTLNP